MEFGPNFSAFFISALVINTLWVSHLPFIGISFIWYFSVSYTGKVCIGRARVLRLFAEDLVEILDKQSRR